MSQVFFLTFLSNDALGEAENPNAREDAREDARPDAREVR